ncbi:MAG: flagellar biosynthesis protein FlhA [Planctomycetaceae bacterium]|nr:flagellar biosynthesis protein FlhA [Planctomycetaceae bacterium]
MYSLLQRVPALVLPLALIGSLLVILIPLPPFLMDLLLAINITASVIILLTTVYVGSPMEFNVFPALLLATTLGRLVLNVATTRLILTNGSDGDLDAAGVVIQKFGEFVAGDQLIVGIIIFTIIVLIQFVVITKGATRISEVSARFTLDAMPGKQMAIDADLAAGIINEHEAQARRAAIVEQADFFAAMDGATKFVRGDAIAGIVITAINIIGGFAIGMMNGMDVAESAELFTKLTIGDGLVSQVPAFLISLAAGLLVTRSTKQSNLPADVMNQLFARPEALMVAGGFMGVLVFTNLPAIPLLTIGGCCLGLAWTMRKNQNTAIHKKEAEDRKKAAAKPEEKIEDYLVIDPMELEIGIGLIRLADPSRGGDLLDRITSVRQAVAADIGIILPKVRIRDNVSLQETQYRIKISNNPVAEGEVWPDRLLAVNTGMATGELNGIEAIDPAFGQPAKWIDPVLRERAYMLKYMPAEPAAVLATHLQEVVRQHADAILTRDATKDLLEQAKKSSPAVVEELVPGVMKVGEVQQVLQHLLREEVPIRQLGTILETLGDFAPKTKDPILLTEFVRHRLARTLCQRYCDTQNVLRVVTLDPSLEDRIAANVDHTERGMFVRMKPNDIQRVCDAIHTESEKLTRMGYPAIILVNPQIRALARHLTSAYLPRLAILSYNEITRDTKVESVGNVML